MKSLIKKLIPKSILNKVLPTYHYFLTWLANLVYLFPSRKIIVIGVTGTSGKTSICNITAKLLEDAGHKVGLATTMNFKIGDKEWLNDKKMTMLGRFQLQKLIYKMVKQNCKYAIIETTSEGIKQSRHIGIAYDILCFTNLSKEHIESHGSFENYKNTKLKIFKNLNKTYKKKDVKKIIISNGDDKHCLDFLKQTSNEKHIYSKNKIEDLIFKIESEQNKSQIKSKIFNLKYEITDSGFLGNEFKINYQNKETTLHTNLIGKFQVENIVGAMTIALSQGVTPESCKETILKLKTMPGRMEVIQHEPFTVIVDFAFLPQVFEKLYKTVNSFDHGRIIHVFGATGGGRDKWKRPVLGQVAAQKSDIIILTNEDPYDEDPMKIIKDVEKGVIENDWKNSKFKNLKIDDKHYYEIIIDRKQAIQTALNIAKPKDVVLITGKGSEQKMCLSNGKMIDWDDREITKKTLNKLNS